jgi:glycosyltransferase involved in cell wall biosynthesis
VRKVRAAVVLDHPAQQFVRAFQLLAAQPGLVTRVYYRETGEEGLPDPGFGRHVKWDIDLLAGYDWWAPERGLSRRDAPRAAWRRLRQDAPDVILCYGWGTPMARVTIAYAAVTGTPLLYYGDTTWQRSGSGRRQRVRAVVLRRLFRRAAGALSTGTFNREFYIGLGMNPALIHPGVCPADTDAFGAAARPDGERAAEAPFVITFAGKFIASKAPEDLVRAAALLPRDRAWEVHLIGDGPTRPAVEDLVAELGLGDRVRFLGFRNTSELPALLASSDVVVVPSRTDLRVLVTIEAMAAGAVLVASSGTAVWGPGDLLQDGETGLVYPVGDVEALAGALRRLHDDPALAARLAAAGRARAVDFGPAAFATSAAAALLRTAQSRAEG